MFGKKDKKKCDYDAKASSLANPRRSTVQCVLVGRAQHRGGAQALHPWQAATANGSIVKKAEANKISHADIIRAMFANGIEIGEFMKVVEHMAEEQHPADGPALM